jgi:putative endopeptidase
VDWWTDADREAFSQLTAKLVEQFSGLVPQVLKDNGIESTQIFGYGFSCCVICTF